MLMTVLAGQPVMDTSNLALVLVNVTIAVPLQVDSASVIGGFSFDAIAPLRGLAPGSACPFHPACAGSSLWRWPRLTAEGRYPLPCPVESGLSSAAFADATIEPARRVYFTALRAGFVPC